LEEIEVNTQKVKKDLLPQKTRWSQSAIARHLCSDRKTVKVYAENLAVVIPDYLKECPRYPNGAIVSGFSLTQYQAWVVCQLVILGREIRSEVNGLAIHKIVKAAALKKAHLLSKSAWMAVENVA
jgi:hypothetical protein